MDIEMGRLQRTPVKRWIDSKSDLAKQDRQRKKQKPPPIPVTLLR